MSEDLKHIERIAGLIIKYHRENLSDSEYRELMDWCDLSGDNRRLFNKISNTDYVKDKELPNIHELKEAGWEKVLSVITAERPSLSLAITPVRRIKGMSYLVAASLVGILTAGAWLYMKHRSLDKTNTPIASNLKNDVAPGGNKATLTLANGQQILLDDAKAGMLTEQGTTQVIKKNAGTLSYTALLNEEP